MKQKQNNPFDSKSVKEIFSRFRKANFEIFIVGGSIRDFLLNKPIKDIDFTTNARPEEIKSLFEKTVDIGARFGTIQVNLDGETFEITTYRQEGNYLDSRHPDKLEFTQDLENDLKRRDFTINGLVMDEYGSIYDFHNGIDDLKNGYIKTIGNPIDRFNEDQLRKWRTIRFAAEKGFELDQETYGSLVYDPNTNNISYERIRDELNKIILSDKVNWGGYLLIRTGLFQNLLRRIFPNDTYINLDKDIQNLIRPFEIMYIMDSDLESRLAALLLLFNKDEAKVFLETLRYSKKEIEKTLKYFNSINITKGATRF